MDEFNLGDVVVHPKYGRGIVQDCAEGWVEFGEPYRTEQLSVVAADLRRLVVIDPEDREQVERLHTLWCQAIVSEGTTQIESMQVALREFAVPKPPKPEEPTGLGAVVQDAEGSKWARIESRTGWWWYKSAGETRRWPDVNAVRVLSEGVQP